MTTFKNPEWAPAWRQLGKVPDGCMLVAKTVEDLDIHTEANFEQVLEKAMEKGLALPCPVDLEVFCKETQDKDTSKIISIQKVEDGFVILSSFVYGQEQMLRPAPITSMGKPSDGYRFLFLAKKDNTPQL